MTIPATSQIKLDFLNAYKPLTLPNSPLILAPTSNLSFPTLIKPVSTDGTLDKALQTKLDNEMAFLKAHPDDVAMVNQVFRDQIELTKKQLNISEEEATKTVIKYFGEDAKAKGADYVSVINALDNDIQDLAGWDNKQQILPGVSLTTANKIAAKALGAAYLTGGIFLALSIVGLFTGVTEVVAGGLVATEAVGGVAAATAIETTAAGTAAAGETGIASLFSRAGLVAARKFFFKVTEMLLLTSIALPMITKQINDVQNIGTSMNIQGIKNAYDLENKIKKGGTSSATVSKATTTATIKVFTGVVSQGVLGSSTSFSPRTDDLISDVGELRVAVQNNLAPYIASIGKKIIYEVKIVSSITDKNGFVTYGQSQQVVTGTHADGTTKYKTVTNKFAVLNLYILSDKGAKTKITAIVLGPTDAVHFTPTQNDVVLIEQEIPATLFTSDTTKITNLTPSEAVNAPTTSANPQVVVTPIKTPGLFRQTGDFGSALYSRIGSHIYSTYLLVPELVPDIKNIVGAGKQGAIALDTLKNKYGVDFNALPVVNIGDLYYNAGITPVGKAGPEGGPDPIVASKSWLDFLALRDESSPAVVTPPAAKKAQNLSEYYTALGQSLPTIADRGKVYEKAGLGTATLYVGSAEQNVKLLSFLIAQ